MSIVQDAVKKAQNLSGYKGSGDKKPGKNKLLLFLVIGGASLALIALVMMKSPRTSASISLKDVSLAETIYKPMSTVAARPDNTKRVVRRRSPPDLILSGIMQLVDGPRAIINDVMVGAGDVIGGARIIKIENDTVTLKDKDRELVLGME
ncbi:MAG: hypothetical protein WC738_02970 [Candidatus Omnitrophota bacterium]|jgi:hypothetical protein